jgi:hypothetical protein
MKYLEFTYIDRVNKTSVADKPAYNGPVYPEVNGLVFEFALESEYPTNVPKFYGTCPDSSDISKPGVVKELTLADYNSIKEKELAVRKENKINQADQAWESKINSGIKYNNVNFSTDDKSRQLITNVAQVALASKVNNTTFNPIQWDGKDDSGNTTSLNLTADQVIELQALIVQDGEVQYNKLRTMTAAIKAASDFSSLNNIAISFE